MEVNRRRNLEQTERERRRVAVGCKGLRVVSGAARGARNDVVERVYRVAFAFTRIYIARGLQRRKEPLYNPRWPPPLRGLLLANTKREAPPWFMPRDGMIYWLFCLVRPGIHPERERENARFKRYRYVCAEEQAAVPTSRGAPLSLSRLNFRGRRFQQLPARPLDVYIPSATITSATQTSHLSNTNLLQSLASLLRISSIYPIITQ